MRISDWSSDVCSSDLLADAAGTTVTGANYTYGTDDLTAVENARDYCWAFTNSIRGGLTLYFPDGRYCLSGGIEFARSYFTVAVQSDQVWLESFRTTSGPAISFNVLPRSDKRRVGKGCVSTCNILCS